MSAPMHQSAERLRYGAEAALFFAFMGFFRLLGLDAASALGGWIGRTVFAHLGPDRTARANLAFAFPEKSQAERNAILLTMWDNLGRTVAEYAHLDRFGIDGRDPRIRIENAALVDAAVAGGKGVLILSGHFANWEAAPIAAACHGLDGGIVFRPPNNPLVAEWIARQRARRGFSEQISKHHGTRRIFTLLRAGKCVLMLADQKTNEGIPAPFFGRNAMTTPAPAALSLKLGAPIILCSNHRRSGAHFTVRAEEKLEFAPSGDAARDISALTALINAKLEAIVRADPGQWLWIHRRWPTAKDTPTGRR